MTLKEALCQALSTLGADPDAFQFDDHSTIVMSFDDVGDIYLDPQGDRVWMWGILDEMEEHVRDALAAPLLAEVIRPVAHWDAGAMILRQDGRVGGLLHPDCQIEPTLLASALQDFHECLGRLQAIR
ncbi:hypothetical protein [Stenotrophomonas tumulicola]|uniref:Uncharacterized protein n=1 Tax=Stenotrophomonas tumulicola TaxID=1685415 RepID=A0A7W3IHI7_9GAMM|nr:hypothetical protein [Stenotrophomonas tumulicola]MBA8682055.1 hypothetical protein [Stenotrophomonas tumulicola]